MKRTKTLVTMHAASTTAVTSTLRVISRTRKDIVSGPPTMATPSVAIPVSMLTSGSTGNQGTAISSSAAKSLPSRLPTKSDAKNRPPRKPDARDTRQAVSFRTMMMAMVPAAISRCRSSSIAPWPAASTCGVTIAMAPTQTPPIAGLIHTGRLGRTNRRSTSGESRITAIPIALTISASTISARYCSTPTAPTLGTSSE